MALESFRFLHASDFHLGQPPGGLCVLPGELIDDLIESTYRAVDAVVDTAIREQVEFVLLSGDVIHFATASPRAIEFLAIQFDRLSEAKIPVYWLGGRFEAGDELPNDFQLPENVHRLGQTQVQTLEVKKGPKTLAYIVGQSLGGHAYANLKEMRVPRDGRFFVGLWYCEDQEQLDQEQLDELGIDYWALGGRHQKQSLDTLIPAEFSGSPQARGPSETGAHGCLLVQVTGDDIDEIQLVPTDTIRYRTERIEVSSEDDQQRLLAKMKSRIQTIRHDVEASKTILITWEFVDDGRLGRQLRRAEEKQRFLELARRETDSASMKVWTIDLRGCRHAVPSALFEEDSILGDFLRAVRDLDHADDWLDQVCSYLPDTPAASDFAARLPLKTAVERQRLLQEVTIQGIDLLSGDQT